VSCRLPAYSAFSLANSIRSSFSPDSYTQNGLLHMLDRNRRIKKCPERFQETKEQFDIIVTVEERVYDLVVLHMESMDSVDNRPVHVLNVDVVDNAEDALMGAFLITDMINLVMGSLRQPSRVHSLYSGALCRWPSPRTWTTISTK